MKTRFAPLILLVVPWVVGLVAAAVIFPAFAPASVPPLSAPLAVYPAGDWQCADPAGCDARINDHGELVTVRFRKGDIVSEEGGWVVSPDDGWRKLRNGDDTPTPKEPYKLAPKKPWWRFW